MMQRGIIPQKLLKIIKEKEYKPEQVFNADETALFWKRMPSRTFLSKENFVSGFKAAKDNRSLLLYANASGNYMVKLTLLYRAMSPRAMKDKNKHWLHVLWQSNKKA